MKLDVGCGQYKANGYVGLDAYIFTDTQADIQASIFHLPFADSSIDEVRCVHMLEHIGRYEVPLALSEFRRVIKPDMPVVIEVPDLAWCCQTWLEHQTTDWYMALLFGLQSHGGEYHKTGFTVPIMQVYLDECHLALRRHWTIDSHGQPTLCFEATKGQ